MRQLQPINHRLILSIVALLLTLSCCTARGFANNGSPLTTTATIVRTPQLSRPAALKKALTQVLVNLSGNPHIASLPNLQDALDNADNWVESYQSQSGIGPTGQVAPLLHVRFNRHAIIQLLQDNQQPIWPMRRPLTLVLINTDDNPTSLISSDSDSTRKQRFSWQMQMRHIPVIWPMLDLNTPTGSPQWPPTEQTVSAKLQQYRAQALLAGRINQSGQSYQADWFAWVNNSPWTWQDSADTQVVILQHAVDHLTTLLANSSAEATNNGSFDITATVHAVNNLTEYAAVINRLIQLPGVSKVSIVESQHNSVTLKITSSDSVATLKKMLQEQVEKIPTLTVNTPGDATENTTLSLRWQTSPNPIAPSTTPSSIPAMQESTTPAQR